MSRKGKIGSKLLFIHHISNGDGSGKKTVWLKGMLCGGGNVLKLGCDNGDATL
jgi:hypothetical protein